MNGGILLGSMLLIVSLIAFGLLLIIFGQDEAIKKKDKQINALKSKIEELQAKNLALQAGAYKAELAKEIKEILFDKKV
jgi:hypothetical protein